MAPLLNKTLFYLASWLFVATAFAQNAGLSTEGQARPRPAPAASAPAPAAPPAAAADAPAPKAVEAWDVDPDAPLKASAPAEKSVPLPPPAEAPANAPVKTAAPEAPPAKAAAPTPTVAPAPPPADPAQAENVEPPAAKSEESAPAPGFPKAATGEDMKLATGQVLVNERAGTELTPSLYGFSGVFRTVSARSSPRDSIRYGAHIGGYYLVEEWDHANHAHLEARGHLAYSILDELEIRIDGIGTGHRSDPSEDGAETEFIQTLGDLSLGGKYTYKLYDYLNVGGLLDFRFYTKLRSMGFRWGSFSMLPMGVVTFDAREQADLQWPLVAHANLGFFLDNSSKVLMANGSDGLTFDGRLTASRINALNVRAGNQVHFNVAFEFPQDEYTVFLEYTTEQETGNKLERGVRKGHWNQSPQRLTPGVRWNFIDRLVGDFAVDIAYGLGEDYIVNRVAARPTTPYQFWLGLTYSYDPGSHKIIDTRGYVKGIVVDAETGEPIGGAIVQYPSGDNTRQVTRDDDGNFTSFPLLPGQAKIRIVKEKYEPVVISPLILGRETITEKVLLRKMDEGGQLVGALVGTVLDSTAKPVSAMLSFVDADIAGTRSNPVDGAFVKILPPGQYKVKVEAEGFDTKVFLVPVEARRKTKVVFEIPASGGSVSTQGALAGLLVDPDGKPIGGIIRFPEAGIREVAANPQTGEFYATLPPGRYKLEVESEGYGKRDYLVPIEAGKKTRIDIKLAQSTVVGAVAGRLLSPDNQPLAGVVKFADPKVGVIPVDPSTGGFMKVLAVGTYDVELSAPGYVAQTVKIQILERRKTVQDFILESVSTTPVLARVDGDSIALERPISFSKVGTQLSAEDKEVLDSIAAILRSNPRKLVIRAYTDDEGPANANFKATQAQAEAVFAYLVEKGIDGGRLAAVGAGEEKPIAPNTSPENKARNRRIEFQLR